jgi:hypothetical protein
VYNRKVLKSSSKKQFGVEVTSRGVADVFISQGENKTYFMLAIKLVLNFKLCQLK